VRIPFLVLGALLACIAIARGQDTAHPVEALDLDSHLDWMDGGAVFLDGRRPKRSLTEEEERTDRPGVLDQAVAKARAEGKLVFWYIPRIIEDSSHGVQMYRAPVLDLYTKQVLFCDEDVANLLRTRFVPLRLTLDEDLSKRFGLRPLKFVEPAVVFLDGEGKVVHYVERIRTFDALWFASLMRRVLVEAGNVVREADLSIEEEIARGRYEKALARLMTEREPGPARLLEETSLLMKLTRADEAAARLEEVQKEIDETLARLDEADGDDWRARRRNPERRELKTTQERLALVRGKFLTLTGDPLAALGPLDEAFRAGEAEAGYLLASNRLALGDEAEAMRLFQLVELRHPDTLFGRRAKANITLGLDERPQGAAFAGFEHFGFLHEGAYRGLPHDTTWNAGALEPAEIAELGVRFLLAHQRSDGGFTDSRYAYWGSSEITPNTWVAITALACTAMLEFRDDLAGVIDPGEIDEALARGERFLLDPTHLNRGENEEVYADAYRVLYFARRASRDPERAEWERLQASRILEEAAGRQGPDGFFAHEYRNAFCTAAMLWAVLEARDAGVPIPEGMLPRGAEALTSARYQNGAYSYGGSARGGRDGSLKDSCGRMATCEGVLLRAGEGSDARLAFAMETFWEFFDRLEQVRRNDFHSDGELAGFFFSHDLFHTSEVLRLLPANVAEPAKDRFLEILQDIPEIDGSFLDSHEFGRSYGTAMALLTLRNVAD